MLANECLTARLAAWGRAVQVHHLVADFLELVVPAVLALALEVEINRGVHFRMRVCLSACGWICFCAIGLFGASRKNFDFEIRSVALRNPPEQAGTFLSLFFYRGTILGTRQTKISDFSTG